MVFLLGCDHYLQEYELTEWDEELRSLEHSSEEKFYELTKKIIRDEGIQFVGEECIQNQRTIPRVLASESMCDYAEIDMPLDERERQGIARTYQSMGESERDRVYAMREQYMVDKVCSNSMFATRKLIICGAEHIKGLNAKFSQLGEQVKARDLTKEDWVLKIYKKKDEKFLGFTQR